MDKLKIMWLGYPSRFDKISRDLIDLAEECRIPETEIIQYTASRIEDTNMTNFDTVEQIIRETNRVGASIIAVPYGFPIPYGAFHDIYLEAGIKLFMQDGLKTPMWCTRALRNKTSGKIENVTYDTVIAGWHTIPGWRVITDCWSESDDDGITYNYKTRMVESADLIEAVREHD